MFVSPGRKGQRPGGGQDVDPVPLCFPWQVILTVYLNDTQQILTEVPVTPATRVSDVVEYCKEAGEGECHLAEVWSGHGESEGGTRGLTPRSTMSRSTISRSIHLLLATPSETGSFLAGFRQHSAKQSSTILQDVKVFKSSEILVDICIFCVCMNIYSMLVNILICILIHVPT